jgi:hypothetical protein
VYYIEGAKKVQSRGARGSQEGTEQRRQHRVQYYIQGAKEVQSRGATIRYSIIYREPIIYRDPRRYRAQYYTQGAKEVQSRGASRRYSIIYREPRRYRAEEPPEVTVLYRGSQ